MVGARGFEPPTSCSQGRRAARLRHAPTGVTVRAGAKVALDTGFFLPVQPFFQLSLDDLFSLCY